MRRNIFDILKENVNIEVEVETIEELGEEDLIVEGRNYYSLEEFVDEYCIRDWKNRNRCITCEQIRKKIGISSLDMIMYSEKEILLYLEYMINMIYLVNNHIKNSFFEIEKEYIYLEENVNGLIDDLGYEPKEFEEKEQVILVEKNSAATAVAEIVEPELAYEVLSYNHHTMKGDIERKQKILKVLADKFEALRPQIKNINGELESNIGFLLNKMNIRHNNLQGKNEIQYVKHLSKKELEAWYDETYQMLLLAFLEVDNEDRAKKVKQLKAELLTN